MRECVSPSGLRVGQSFTSFRASTFQDGKAQGTCGDRQFQPVMSQLCQLGLGEARNYGARLLIVIR